MTGEVSTITKDMKQLAIRSESARPTMKQDPLPPFRMISPFFGSTVQHDGSSGMKTPMAKNDAYREESRARSMAHRFATPVSSSPAGSATKPSPASESSRSIQSGRTATSTHRHLGTGPRLGSPLVQVTKSGQSGSSKPQPGGAPISQGSQRPLSSSAAMKRKHLGESAEQSPAKRTYASSGKDTDDSSRHNADSEASTC